MTMNAERIAELRGWLRVHIDDLKLIEKEAKKTKGQRVTPIRMDLYVGPYYRDLLSVLDDYEKKLADLRLVEADRDIAIERREYAEAELEKVKAEVELLNENAMRDYAGHLELKARAEKAEAELARYRPMIEAAEKATFIVIDPAGRKVITANDDDLRAILRAALKGREGK